MRYMAKREVLFNCILDEFDKLISKARRDGRKAGLKQADIKEAISKVRGEK